MGRLLRFVVRPPVLGLIAAALLATSVASLAARGREPSARPYTPTPQELAAIDLEDARPPHREPAPPPTPTPTPSPKKSVAAKKPKPAGPSVVAFRGLGAWVDLYDYEAVSPEAAADQMRANGVKTLYLQTARWNKPAPDDPKTFYDAALVERWLHASHARGIKVVGWYLPAYDEMARDLKRTTAIATFRTGAGQRFDALAIDIEEKGQMDTLSAWNAALLDHAQRVRRAVGSRYPVAAITPSPLGMAVRPTSWAGFPWEGLAAVSDVFMPMSYWSYRDDCPEVPEHCAYGYTKGNVEQVRELTKRAGLAVHVIGGVGDAVSTAEVADFVRAARETRSYGGSLYDWRTTQGGFWAHLRKLNG